MKEDLISCIVPVFNGERYLAEAIKSILTQNYPSIEIIVADDGSTDATAAVEFAE
jgi:glycosyltransferase involved in cell wall biosynthesis